MYERILTDFFSTPWAILLEKLAIMQELLLARAGGLRFSHEEIVARIGAEPPARQSAQQVGAVAVIPVFGVISQRMDLLGEISGGTSTERLGRMIRQAVDDPSIGAIVLNVDSPGGSVYGVDELSSLIYQSRERKKIVAIANSLSASAAYYTASAAEEVIITPGGEAGSIGVYAAHVDYSKVEELLGKKTTLISAGKFKTEGNPFEPLGDEARAFMQKRVDEYYEAFIKAVSRNRGVSVGDVRNGYGEGRVVGAKEAVSIGLADRVETLDETIERLSSSRRAQQPRRRASMAAMELEALI